MASAYCELIIGARPLVPGSGKYLRAKELGGPGM